jgi:cytochrome c5
MSASHANAGSAGKKSSNVGVWVAIIAVVTTFLVGTRMDPLSSATGGGAAAPAAKDAPKDNAEAEATKTAALAPSAEMPLPDGPNIDDFQNACLTCHSARLPLGQPPFGREKWGEIVHKMAASYGAPLTPEIESKVVDYIVAVRPPKA